MKLAAYTVLGITIAASAGWWHTPQAPQEADRMPQREIATLREMTESVNAGDAARYARLYSSDAVITIHGSGRISGRGAIEQYESGLMREFPGARLAFYSAWHKTPLAVVHYGVNGQTADGRSMGHEGLLFFRFHSSGTIEDERRYLDSLTPMAQLGVLGAVRARPLPVLPSEMTVHRSTGSPEESRNIALVRTSLAAIQAKDAAAFLSHVSDDATVDELMLPEVFAGREGVHRWFEMWSGAVPDMKVEVIDILGAGDFVLVETVARGTLAVRFGELAASDRPFAVHRALAIQVKAGKLARLASFMNGKELAEATGQWPLR